MIAVERHGGVERLRMSSRVSRRVGYEVSAYVVRGVLVDSGSPSVRDELRRLVVERRTSGAPISAAVVTHWHEDHGGNVPLLAELGVPTWLAAETFAKLHAHPRIGRYRRLTWGSTTPLPAAPPALDRDALAAAGLEVLHMPGHSPDHHVVWDAERGTLFGGDLFLGVKVRVAHPAEQPRVLVESLRRAAALRPALFFDGHRDPIERPVEALLAKAEWLSATIGGIERLVDAGWSDRAIRRELLGPEDLTGWLSSGEYSRLNLVRRVRETR